MYLTIDISGPYHIALVIGIVMFIAAILIDLSDRRPDLVFVMFGATIAATLASWWYS